MPYFTDMSSLREVYSLKLVPQESLASVSALYVPIQVDISGG